MTDEECQQRRTPTRGPWRVNDHRKDEGCLYIEADRVSVASVFTDNDLDVDDANARLIAAAPDLLEALQDLVAYSECSVNEVGIWNAARNAIEKAGGPRQ